MQNVAALERSDNVVERGHAFAGLKRGYTRTAATLSRGSSAATPGPRPRFRGAQVRLPPEKPIGRADCP